jgi:NAD(P) transhydrogenase subunit beta
MLLAVLAALFDQGIASYGWIFAGFIVGGAIGAAAARMVQMTAMPEMVALFNGFGGLASLLRRHAAAVGLAGGAFTRLTIVLSILIGGVTFTGSIVAWGKLSEKLGNLKALPNQRAGGNSVMCRRRGRPVLRCCSWRFPTSDCGMFAVVLLSLAFGYLARGADRRRRYAGGDLPAQLLLGSCRLCGGFRHSTTTS